MRFIIPGRLKLRLNNCYRSTLRILQTGIGFENSARIISEFRSLIGTNKVRRFIRAGLLFIALGAVSSCSLLSGDKNSKLDQILTPLPDENSSASPDSKIGAKEHPKIVAAHGGVYADPKLSRTLEEIVATLTAHSKDGIKKYTITILNSPSVNAFALPGGYLYVTRGLLALANDKAEVAAVLAHEMSHVSANHGIKRIKKLEAIKLADRVVLDVLSNDRAGKVALAANKINLATFSQNQELQSDALGIRMLGSAGFDPYAAARFLDAMNSYAQYQNSLSNKNGEQDFLSTHPSTPKRIELAKRHARVFGRPGSGISNRDQYLKSLDGMLFGDSALEGYVRGNRFAHAGLGITFKVPGGYKIDNKASAVVISGPNQIAVRFDGVSQPRDVKLTDYLHSGWVNGLKEEHTTTATVNGLKTAYGEAEADGWIFNITLIRVGLQVYRFILAAPKSAKNSAVLANQISQTFRTLSRAEKKGLRPLRLKVIRVGTGDTIANIATRMRGVQRRLDLFRLLNRLKPGERAKPGTWVKIVVNG